jgi:pantetheine-phosphate adenylyltransferase
MAKKQTAKKTAIYPGTFDPITFGHTDVLQRASRMFDKVIIAVAESSSKSSMFSADQRVRMIKSVTAEMKNVSVDSFKGLLVDYAKSKNAGVIIRGLRAISDFEYEFRMALTNRRIANNIETVFLMPGENYSFISSSLVREIAKYGGDVSSFVPAIVIVKLKDILKKTSKR